jgi:hypothetical protein
LRLVGDHTARGAEVDQHRVTVGLDLDVVRRDVAVIDAGLVQVVDGPEQRIEHAAQPGLVGRFGQRGADLLERAALQNRHRHVRGAVGLPEPVDLEKRRVVEARQQLGLVDEGLQAQRKGLGVGLRAQ